jgi:cysteine-rich repeat protein
VLAILSRGRTPSRIHRICGDGIRDLSEECDDANTVDGDGCSRYCLAEGHQAASSEPSIVGSVLEDHHSSSSVGTHQTDPVTGVEYYCDASGKCFAFDPTLGVWRPYDPVNHRFLNETDALNGLQYFCDADGQCYAFDPLLGMWRPYDPVNHRFLNQTDPVTGIQYFCNKLGQCYGFDPLANRWYLYDPYRHMFLEGPNAGIRPSATPQTGPGLIVVALSGAAAGIALIRRRLRLAALR